MFLLPANTDKAVHKVIYHLSLFLAVVTPGAILANDSEAFEPNMRYVRYHLSYTVNEDLTHVERVEVAKKVLKESAVNSLKQASVSFSTSIQHADVIEAYTLKADGRRLDAPKDNFQIRTNKGARDNAPVFSDRTRLTVVFPEVEVGDTTVFIYRVVQTEPMFPGHFSTEGLFPGYTAWDDVYIRLDAPEQVDARYKARDMSEKITVRNGRRILEWRFKNSNPAKNTREDYSVWDSESVPGFAYSTFKSYRQIAETYGERALPKAKVTDRVSRLADEIVGNESDKHEQARLLYNWVSTMISYAGNCIGVGAVVPHDISFILDNRMGDCKDHATLLQALLKAKGIQSTQALVNSGSSYKLETVPRVSSVNHVINYLPEFDLFVDSTSSGTPFGFLPFSVSDKPVILVEGYRDGTKTPPTPQEAHQQRMQTEIHIVTDGSANGEAVLEINGSAAAETRKAFKQATADQMKKWMAQVFSSNGHLGSGSFEQDDSDPASNTYSMKVKFDMPSFIHRPGAGAFRIEPLLPSSGPIEDYVSSMVDPVGDHDATCVSGKSEEEYRYVFPDDMQLLAKPEDRVIEGAHIRYTATYELDGNTLKVVRTFDDRTPGNVCSPEVLKQQRALGLKIIQNLNSQAVYK